MPDKPATQAGEILRASVRGFDALIGELVCLKTQSGEMVIGYLNETSDVSRVNPDKSVVNFSIQQIDYTEVIDIDS